MFTSPRSTLSKRKRSTDPRFPLLEPLESRLLMSVTLNTGADTLTQADFTTPLPTNSTVILIADADNDGFGDFTQATESFLADPDDTLLAHFGTDDSNGPGSFLTPITFTDPSLTGADLLLVWYDLPFNAANTGPGEATPFGTFRTDDITDGTDPWVVPSDGSTIALTLLTDSAGGSTPDPAASTNQVTNDPAATAPSIISSSTASIPENQSSVLNVNAIDDSDSEGSGLSYSLTGGADQALFDINQSSGILTFATAPDFDAPADAGGNNVYDVQVTVTDSNNQTDVQDIAVTVTNVNEAPTLTGLTLNADMIGVDELLTLTATGVSDPDSNIAAVQFFRDINTNGVPDVGELIAEDSNSADGFSAETAIDWPLGTHTYLAVVTDTGGLSTQPASATGDVAFRVILDSRGSLRWSDPDGTVSTIRFTNATATAFLFGDNLVQHPTSRVTDISGENIFLTQLNIDAGAGMRASVTTSATRGDNAFAVGNINVTGSLTRFGGRGLAFDDLNVTGSLAHLTVGDLNTSTITIGDSMKATRFIAGNLTDTTITSPADISLQGNTIGNLTINTNGSIKSLRTRGDLSNSSIVANQQIGTVSTKAITDVSIIAGERMGSLRATNVFNLSIIANEDAGRISVTSWDGDPGNANNFINAGFISSLTSRGTLNVSVATDGTGARRSVLGNVRGTDISGVWHINGHAARITGSNFIDFSAAIHGDLTGLTSRGDFMGNLSAANIRSLSIRGAIRDSFIAAGANFGVDGRLGGGDDNYGPGELQSLVAGSVVSSFIAAGIFPSDNIDIITNFDSHATVPNPQQARIRRISIRTELSTDSRLASHVFPTRLREGRTPIDAATDDRIRVI